MIDFKQITIETRDLYNKYLPDHHERGCEVSFANLNMWGEQYTAVLNDHLLIFSLYNGNHLYTYPIGQGDKKAVLDAIINDARERQIPCRIVGLYGNARETIESLYPDMFSFQSDRDAYDYVYSIDDLADLEGRKYHKKRTHINKFRKAFPEYCVKPLNKDNIDLVKPMLEKWYSDRLSDNPDNDYHSERKAIDRAFSHYDKLNMEGLLLLSDDHGDIDESHILAVTLGSQLSDNTFDVHFEKARWDVDGAYTTICCEFAKYIREKYPHIMFLNREEDMGLEGLRKSKESYYPHHMIEKTHAALH